MKWFFVMLAVHCKEESNMVGVAEKFFRVELFVTGFSICVAKITWTLLTLNQTKGMGSLSFTFLFFHSCFAKITWTLLTLNQTKGMDSVSFTFMLKLFGSLCFNSLFI